VGVPVLGYNEHAHRWRQAGHDVVPLAPAEIEFALGGLDVLVLCNPNNPTGERFAPATLLEWHAHLSSRGGWLIVDEAFIDTTPTDSVARFAQREGLIILRSLGKFFGLAGARVGFVLSSPVLAHALMEWLGPWTIAGPSRLVAKTALEDRDWQELTRQRLRGEGARLGEALARHGLEPTGGCDLFQWVAHPNALAIHESLARNGILTRYFAAVPSVRFGLPAREEDWQSLEGVLRAPRTRAAVARLPLPNGAHEVAK
jgi:cobalamin biosynthetic protein CobC